MAEEYPFSAEELNEEVARDSADQEELTMEDFNEITAEGLPSHRPSFPLVTFAMAVTTDLVNLFTLGFLGIITGAVMIVLIWVYLFGKYGGIKRWAWRRALLRLGIKSIPFLGPFLLSWSWFVFRAHSKNYKSVDQILSAAERLLLKG